MIFGAPRAGTAFAPVGFMTTTRYALVLPLCMLCVQCGAAQESAPVRTAPASAEAEPEMRPAALIVPPTWRAEPPEGAVVNTALNDAQTAGVLDAIVQTELAQARVAGRKARSYRVAELAAVIITRRSATEQDLAGFTSMLPRGTEQSGLLTRVRADAHRVTGTMASLTGSDFDMAYVAGQIRQFSRDIIVLDTRLIPDAQAPELERIAKELRNAIIDNLAAAKALRNELIRKAGR